MADPQVVIEMIKNLAQSEFGLPLSLPLNLSNPTNFSITRFKELSCALIY
jgi:hypothetical protein